MTQLHLEFVSLKGGCTGSSESTLVKMSYRWKSYVSAHYYMVVLSYFDSLKFKYDTEMCMWMCRIQVSNWQLKSTPSLEFAPISSSVHQHRLDHHLYVLSRNNRLYRISSLSPKPPNHPNPHPYKFQLLFSESLLYSRQAEVINEGLEVG